MSGTIAGAGCNTWQRQAKMDLMSLVAVRLIQWS